MGFKITPGFSQQSVEKYLKDQTAKIQSVIINRLQFVGEAFIVNARNNNTYKDKTGNLRSSIGYVIAQNGRILHQSFAGNAAEGVAKGTELARQIAARHPKGFVLIGVAGMEYAAAVEAKGYDVISGAAQTAKEDLKRAIASLNAKLGTP